MVLLVIGMIDLGRGFYFQTELTDSTRDAARVLIAPGSGGSPGPGYQAGCNQAERDLANIGVSNVACQLATTYPFTYTPPSAYQAQVLIWCGTSGDCSQAAGTSAGSATTCDNQNSPHTCVAVGIDYTFAILSQQIQQIGGPTINMVDATSMVTLW